MERLQKVIAQAGIASRRKAEEMIKEGRVEVNGEVIVEMGYKVKKGDFITVDGDPIEKEDKVYFLMNKPKKTICSNNDEHGRTQVSDLIPCEQRIFTVGRLDYDTSGLILLTNDGEFANTLVHPRYHIPKTYNLTINGVLSVDEIKQIESGIILDDGIKTLPAKIKMIHKDYEKKQCSFDLTIKEGRNRQIKRMMEALGYNVTRLHRTQLAFLKCSDLSQGEYRVLKPFEVQQLKMLANLGKMKAK